MITKIEMNSKTLERLKTQAAQVAPMQTPFSLMRFEGTPVYLNEKLADDEVKSYETGYKISRVEQWMESK